MRPNLQNAFSQNCFALLPRVWPTTGVKSCIFLAKGTGLCVKSMHSLLAMSTAKAAPIREQEDPFCNAEASMRRSKLASAEAGWKMVMPWNTTHESTAVLPSASWRSSPMFAQIVSLATLPIVLSRMVSKYNMAIFSSWPSTENALSRLRMIVFPCLARYIQID